MKPSLVVVALFAAFSFSSCTAIRTLMVNSSTRTIKGCSNEQISVSETYVAKGTIGVISWQAFCRDEAYECTGFPQIVESVKCKPLPANRTRLAALK